MNHITSTFPLFLLLAGLVHPAPAQKPKAETEEDYYKILRFDPPPAKVLDAGAMELLPDGKIAVGTRRGEIWLIDNAYDPDPEKAKFTRFAHGLHEVLGLGYR